MDNAIQTARIIVARLIVIESVSSNGPHPRASCGATSAYAAMDDKRINATTTEPLLGAAKLAVVERGIDSCIDS